MTNSNYLASFVKAADQAFILEGNGTITVQPDPSKIVFSSEFLAKLEEKDVTGEASAAVPGSRQADTAMILQELGNSDNIRQRGDVGLYGYFIRPTSTWQIALALVLTCLATANEMLPGALCYVRPNWGLIY